MLVGVEGSVVKSLKDSTSLSSNLKVALAEVEVGFLVLHFLLELLQSYLALEEAGEEEEV